MALVNDAANLAIARSLARFERWALAVLLMLTVLLLIAVGVALPLAHRDHGLTDNLWIGSELAILVGYLAIFVWVETAVNTRLRRAPLAAILCLVDGKPLTKRMKRELLRLERWQGQLSGLNEDQLKQAMTVLESLLASVGERFEEVQARKMVLWARLYIRFLTCVEAEIESLPSVSPQQIAARGLVPMLHKTLEMYRQIEPVSPTGAVVE